MAFIYDDRVQEVSSTTGTGTISMGGAVAGYQTFSAAFATGNQIYYCISDHNTGDWEVGYGTLTSGAPWTLSRTAVSSSNANALVSFIAGTRNVFCTWPAAMAQIVEGFLNSSTPTANKVLTATSSTTATWQYPFIPQNSQSVAYTTVASDAGSQILHPTADTTARTFTIAANSSVPYPIGTAITFVNQHGAGILTIAITTDAMYLAGAAATTGNRTLTAYGTATAMKVTSTEWVISGAGLT